MKRFRAPSLLVLVAGLMLALVADRAYAAWKKSPQFQQPPAHAMSPKAPTRKTAGAAAEVNWTLTETGVCVQMDCTVAAAYLVGSSASAPVATTNTGNNLFASTQRIFCMMPTDNYISAYLSAAGECKVSELNTP